MTFINTSALGLTALATTLLAAAPVAAAVTAADVWANSNAPMVALGGVITATPTVDGSVTTYSGARSDFTLPFGAGAIGVGLPTMAMTENGDGTVSVTFPDGYNLSLSADLSGQGSYAAELAGDAASWTMTAAGDPGNITYTYVMPTFQMTLVSIVADGEKIEGVTASATINQTDGSVTMTIVEGDTVSMTMSSTAAETNSELNYAVDGLVSGNNSSVATGSQASVAFSVPAGGLDLLNLATGLRAGLLMSVQSSAATTVSTSTTRDSLGVIQSEQSSSQNATSLQMIFDRAGLAISGGATDVKVDLRDQMLPFPVNFSVNRVMVDYAIPLLADPAPQTLVLGMTLDGVSVNDAIWNMIDAGAALDRSPATFAFDLNADVILDHDLLDAAAMGQLGQTGQIPGTVPHVSLKNLTIAALGANVTASSELDLDWSTMPVMGAPMPAGTFNFRTEGLTGAMNALTAAGLLSPEDTMPVTMGLGMVGRAVGDDIYEGAIEMTADGHIFANGVQLQ